MARSLMRRLRAAVPALVAIAPMLAAAPASAALTFYTTRAEFDAAAPGLAIEGFENVAAETFNFTGPLDSATSVPGLIDPGDILPGITFSDEPGPDEGAMFIAGPGQSSNPTTALGQNFPSTDALDIFLDPGVSAIGFDIFQNFGGGNQSGETQLYPVSVFGASGLLGSILVSVPSGGSGFFGVTSDIPGEIIRVSVNLETAFDVIDTVAFGSAAAPVPEPSTFALAGLGGLALAGLARRRRRA